MKKTLLTFLKWIPSFIIFAISFYLSSQSTIEQMPTFSYADKIVHFICFGGLAFWVAFGCNSSENKKIKIVKLKYDVRQLFDKSQDRVCLLLE